MRERDAPLAVLVATGSEQGPYGGTIAVQAMAPEQARAKRFLADLDRTHSVSAAFIRELLRKAALFAADEGAEPLVVLDRHLDAALHDLVLESGDLTKTILGGASAS